MPAETKSQLSPECIDFLSCLLAGPESRIGSNRNGFETENGFKQVVQHPWFRGFDWDGLHEKEGQLLPSGSREFPELLEYLKYVSTLARCFAYFKLIGFSQNFLMFVRFFARSLIQNVPQI